MEKKVKWMTQYSKLFAKAMKKYGRKDYKKLENLFRNRYMDHLCSEEFEAYKKYGMISIEKIYAAITHAQICLEIGLTLEESQRIWEAFIDENERKIHVLFCSFFDCWKNGYRKIANHLENEARKYKADGSMVFDILERNEEKLEFKVSKCVYVEIFEAYGIKSFCKVFCKRLQSLECMKKTADLRIYSNMIEDNCCHVELLKR